MARNSQGDTVGELSQTNAAQAAFCEGLRQQAAGRLLVDAARAQVEQLARVDFTDGRSMAALDVVGINLELGFGVDLGVLEAKDGLMTNFKENYLIDKHCNAKLKVLVVDRHR